MLCLVRSTRQSWFMVAGGGKVFLDNVGLGLQPVVVRCKEFMTASQVLFKSSDKENLGQTTVILQDGVDMQEVPAIVRNLKNAAMVNAGVGVIASSNNETDFPDPNYDKLPRRDDTEFKDVVAGIKKCYTVNAVLHNLSDIPEDGKTPEVALHALRKIIEVQNNENFRNERSSEDMILKNSFQHFSRMATLNELVDAVSMSNDSSLVLEALKVLSREPCENGSEVPYRDNLCAEALIRVADGRFSILQICEVMHAFAAFKRVKEINDHIDKMWVGIVERDSEISESNIAELFKILPLLQQSRKLILNILEKKVDNGWWRMSASSVAAALTVMVDIKASPVRILNALSRWMVSNIHAVEEDFLLAIVRGFSSLEYMNKHVEEALERFVKLKGLQVKNPAVMASIMDYCAQFRLRSSHIMEGCGEYFIVNGHSFSPHYIQSFFIPFGLLDYPPPNGLKFWKVLETAIDSKFIQFRPEDVLSLMLTCVYLEKYPINFIKKIFNPYFLDRLHSTIDQNVLQMLRTKLKLFDTAMTLECPSYRGPLLPKDHSAKSLWQDGRIKRMVNTIMEPLSRISGGGDITTSVVLTQLPTMGLYVIDMLLHPRGMGASMLQFNLRRDPNVYVAVLVHIPEHYCSDGKYLLGPQMMRKRHFRRLGLKVAELEYDQLAKLQMHPQALESYLVRKIRLADKAI